METFENKLELFDEYKALKRDLEYINDHSELIIYDIRKRTSTPMNSSKYTIQLINKRIKQLENILK
jgi:hypothetical protein